MTQPSELLELIDPRFDELTATRVTGSIAADARHDQPWGLRHPGRSPDCGDSNRRH